MNEFNNQSTEDLQVTATDNNPYLINCPACGMKISRYAPACIKCGHPIIPISSIPISPVPLSPTPISSPKIEPTLAPQQQIVIEQPVNESNGVGTAGFIISLISLILSWVPGVNWGVWFIGFLLSFFGMFSKPRGLAVAGILISLIDLIILVAFVATLATIMSTIFGIS